MSSIDPLQFATALLREAAGPAETNFVCSPWSVASALAALAPGTDAKARDEIAVVVGPSEGLLDIARFVGQAAPGDASVLAVINRLWIDEGRIPNRSFVAQLQQWPGTGLRTAPIRREPETARGLVNADVASTTRGLIPEILGKGTLGGTTAAVLVNALYLLAGWLEPFRPEDTVEEPFRTPGVARRVPMMRARRDIAYAGTHSWEYAAVPLGAGMQAEIVLAPEGEEEPLAAGRVATLREAASPHRVDLHLPRTRLAAGTSLLEPLAALGVRRIFDAGATAVDGVTDQPLAVSDAVHQAVLRVDEQGVEGAAATAMALRAVALRRLPEVELVVDRPFFLLITHRATGTVLFMARVAAP